MKTPLPSKTNFKTYMGLSATQYNMLFSFYFLPNVVMPLFIGYLADLFGRKTGLLFCAVMITFGHLLFAFGF
jgi:MFS family permease